MSGLKTNGMVLGMCVCVVLGVAACGDSDDAADDTGNNTTASTNSSTTSTNNATTSTNSATTSTNAATSNSGTVADDGDRTNDVVELAVRRLGADQDLGEFEQARDTFVGVLRAQDGVGTDREFEAFFDFGTQNAPEPPVFVGMTQYDSLEVFGAVGDRLGGSAEAGAFFSTFTPEAFTALRPLEPGAEVDLASIASGSGQVLEVAVRDLSAYDDFDQTQYEGARDAFLALLSQQPGFVAEYQWVSALDPNIVVGMTVYASMEAFFGVLSDDAFVGAPETGAFLFGYAPAAGYVNAVVR